MVRDDTPLLLRAVDPEGLVLAAACLQDAVASVADMAYVPGERRFALLVERFRWERRRRLALDAPMEVVRAAVCFDQVRGVRRRGLAAGAVGLELLTLTFAPAAAGEGGTVDLVFAGGGTIRLDVAALACRIEDLGEPIPSPIRPRHRL